MKNPSYNVVYNFKLDQTIILTPATLLFTCQLYRTWKKKLMAKHPYRKGHHDKKTEKGITSSKKTVANANGVLEVDEVA